jgi:uncharacterized beta-barrel protein YwiB (DUF1934 family)
VTYFLKGDKVKIDEKTVKLIRSQATKIYMDFPQKLSYTQGRGFVSDKDRQTIAYIRAVIGVLDLEGEVELFCEHGKAYRRY